MVRALVFFLALSLALTSSALAQEQRGEESFADVREMMERGQELYLQGRFLEAAEEFQRAYERQPFGAFLYNVAVAYERHGSHDRAADFFSRYLEREPNASDAAEVRARIERERTLAQSQEPPVTDGGTQTDPDGGVPTTDPDAGVATTDPDAGVTQTEPAPVPPPDGVPRDMKSLVAVETNPVGAQVTVKQGDRVVASGPSPFAYTLEAGQYNISVEHPDFRTVEGPLRVTPGVVHRLIVEMSQGEFLGYVRVVSNVPGARVYIDNRDEGVVGRTPFQSVIATGHHRIWVERPGYQEFEREIDVPIGEHLVLRVDLSLVDHGRIRVTGNIPGSRIYVDDRQVGVIPFEGDVAPGPRRVRVEADDMKDWERQIDVRQGQLTPIRVRLRPAVSRTGAWVTSTIAVLSIAGGVVLGLLANGLENDLIDARDHGRLASNDPRFMEGTIYSIAADSAFGLGTILGILGVYYFLRDPLPPSEATVLEPHDWAFAPFLSPTAVGGSLESRF